MTDCALCIEWEICPFHKPEPKLTPYDVAESAVETVRMPVSQPPVNHGKQNKRIRVVSDCGHYWRTIENGVCVDEEPID